MKFFNSDYVLFFYVSYYPNIFLATQQTKVELILFLFEFET